MGAERDVGRSKNEFSLLKKVSIYSHLSACYLKTIYGENELIHSIYEYTHTLTYMLLLSFKQYQDMDIIVPVIVLGEETEVQRGERTGFKPRQSSPASVL